MTMTLDPRSSAAREAAEEAFRDAETAAEFASAAVDDARQLLALGRAKPGDVIKAQRALARAMETREQARSAVKAVDRAAAELNDADRVQRRARDIAEGRRLAVERDELEDRIAAFLEEVDDRATELDTAAKDWDDRARPVRTLGSPGRLTIPSDLVRDWSRFIDGLRSVRRAYPQRKAGNQR